jgi:N-acetylmuramoyl-L-alanine amidase
MKRVMSLLALAVLLFVSVFTSFDTKALAAAKDKNVVVVIDPGHGGVGGRNLGAVYNGRTEKDLTLSVANAMKTELEKYDNVTVYLTRTSDSTISLEERAEYAKSVNADFVFSIHFNASSEHNFYGSEVWTSAFNKYYQAGYDFGQIESKELEAIGLYQKGVKTKIGETGEDYYGIIRHCVARGIPCDIIEHCYMDHAYDLQYLGKGDFYTTLGICDATAVAKYFNLKSSVNGNDFSNYAYTKVGRPKGVVHQDYTEPSECRINVLSYDKESRNALVEMTTYDKESPVIYFTYSYDGSNFYILQMWDRTKETQSFNVKIPAGMNSAKLICRAYNSYELFKQSNEVDIATR